MEDKVKELKGQLVNGLKSYFNNDLERVKLFGSQLKLLGFDLNDYDTLVMMQSRSEALIVLLGLSDFGALDSVVKSVEHLKGRGTPDEFITHNVNIFMKPQQ